MGQFITMFTQSSSHRKHGSKWKTKLSGESWIEYSWRISCKKSDRVPQIKVSNRGKKPWKDNTVNERRLPWFLVGEERERKWRGREIRKRRSPVEGETKCEKGGSFYHLPLWWRAISRTKAKLLFWLSCMVITYLLPSRFQICYTLSNFIKLSICIQLLNFINHISRITFRYISLKYFKT